MSGEHNLYVQAYYKGGMTGFEVILEGDIYHIARDGKIIASLRHNGPAWQQLSGEEFPEDALESICQEIEKKQA